LAGYPITRHNYPGVIHREDHLIIAVKNASLKYDKILVADPFCGPPGLCDQREPILGSVGIRKKKQILEFQIFLSTDSNQLLSRSPIDSKLGEEIKLDSIKDC